MTVTVAPGVRPAAPSATHEPRSERLLYLDNLKVVLIAWVIVGHAAITYGTLGTWIYEEKARGSGIMDGVTIVAEIGWLFLVGLFFLISGLLTPKSLAHKGPGQFVRDRLTRLGIPLLAFLFVVMPPVRYIVYVVRSTGEPSSFWTFVRHQAWWSNLGPMWFVAFLLVFSLAYVGWRQLRPASTRPAGPLTPRFLVVLALSIAVGSAILRLIWPFDSRQPLNLHVGLWVQYPLMFWLGVISAERGWLAALPSRLWRQCGVAAAVAALAVPVLVLASGGLGSQEGATTGWQWPWPDLVLAGIEGVLAVSASTWTLEYFRRRHNRQGRLGRELARSAYAAFILQTPVLVGIALALRPTTLPAELKFLLVACSASVLSFALGWLLIARVPGVRRVL